LLVGDFATAIAHSLRTTLAIMHEHQDLLAMVYLQVGLTVFTEPSEVEAEWTRALTAALADRMTRDEARSCDPEKAALSVSGNSSPRWKQGSCWRPFCNSGNSPIPPPIPESTRNKV